MHFHHGGHDWPQWHGHIWGRDRGRRWHTRESRARSGTYALRFPLLGSLLVLFGKDGVLLIVKEHVWTALLAAALMLEPRREKGSHTVSLEQAKIK